VSQNPHIPVLAQGPQEPEEWRVVPGLEDLYIASSLGRIARMVGHSSAASYRHVCLPRKLAVFSGHSMGASRKHKNNVRVYAHHIIALTFIGPPPSPDRMRINHIDGNRTNNRHTNLEWCSQRHNIQQAWKNGQILKDRGANLSLAERSEILRRYRSGETYETISNGIGRHYSTIGYTVRTARKRGLL